MEEPAVMGIVDCLCNRPSPLQQDLDPLETKSTRTPTYLAYGRVIKSWPMLSEWKSSRTEALWGKIFFPDKDRNMRRETPSLLSFFRYCCVRI